MSFHQDNFLGSFAGAGDVSAAIAALDDKVFYKDGSRSMEGPISMVGNLLIGTDSVQVNELAVGILPPSGQVGIYAKADKELYIQDDTGLETHLSSGGDMDGPASSTDDALAVYDGITGKLLKDSSITVGATGVDLIIPQGGGVIFTESKSPPDHNVEVTAGSMGASYTIVLPTFAPTAGDCFVNASGDNASWEPRVEFDDSNGTPPVLNLIPVFEDLTGNVIEQQSFLGIDITTGNMTRLTLPWITTTGTSTGWGTDSMINITTSVLNYSAGDSSCEELDTGLGKNVCIGIRCAQGAIGAEYSNVTAIGHEACQSLSSSQNIVAIGTESLTNLTGSSNNVVSIGSLSGVNLTTGSSNVVLVSNPGVVSDTNLMKIGTQGVHLTTFLAGVTGVTPSAGGVQNVIIDSDGQLGSEALLESTGVLSGGLLTVNADDTKFDVSDGTGFITNTTTLVTTPVSWSGLTAQSTAYVGDETFISINAAGAVVFSTTLPANDSIRDNIYLGQIVHLNQINLNTTLGEQMTLLTPANQIRDFMQAIGELKINGNICSSNLLLTIAKTAGEILKFGGNFRNDIDNPHLPTSAALDTNVADVFAYFWQDGSNRTMLTSIVPSEFDDGNGEAAPGTVSTNNWTVQRIFTFSIGQMVIQQGQFTYNSKDLAIQNIESEGFVIESDLAINAVLISFLAVRGGATDLSLAGDAEFLEASKFGGSSPGTAAGISGPASSTDNAVVRWDSTSGTIVQNSGVIIDDSDNVTGIVGLTATGAIDMNTVPSFDLQTTDNTSTACQIRAQGGIGAEIHIENSTGTNVDAIKINASAGGLDLDAANNILLDSATGRIDLHTVSSTGNNAIQLNSLAGGIEMDAVKSINMQSTQAGASAVKINATAGGVDIDSLLTINLEADDVGASAIRLDATAGGFNFDAATDILMNTATGRIDLEATADATGDAIMLNAAAGGVDINAALDVDIDAASDFFVDTATGRIDLHTVASTSSTAIQLNSVLGGVNISSGRNAAQCIHLHANAGVTETIRIHSDQGTSGASIDIESDAGGIQIIAESSVLADAIKLDSQSGGIDIDGSLDVNIGSDTGRIDLRTVTSTSGIAIQLDAAAGGVGITSDGLASASAVQLKALDNLGGVEISAGGAGLLSLNQAAGTRELEFFGAGGVVQATTGVAENTFVVGAGTAVNDNSTFGGYTLQQVVNAMQLYGLLA